ncbi:MAG TPA: serine--tRNA ligase [Candidatus Acidoferrales bacterium]
MLDLNFVREHLELVERKTTERGMKVDFHSFRTLDEQRRRAITEAEKLKALRNKANEEIGALRARGEDASEKIARMKEVSDRIKKFDEVIHAYDDSLREFLMSVPNVAHESVPAGSCPEQNLEVRRWGAPPKFDFPPKPHWEVAERLGILDLPRAAKIAGARFALYQGAGAQLERALAAFMLDLHTRSHGYTEVLPPFIVNSACLVGTGNLPRFAADLFHLEATDYWLSPTAEVQLTNLYRDEILEPDRLPIKLTAWTGCFRSEAGAAGKETRGIMRQHQFQKVELVKLTRPETSFDELESLARDAEEVLQQLGLHYRVTMLCTGDMGFASAKTYDLEVWLPSTGEFKEISSCSNCTSFQARRASIRYRPQPRGKTEFVHTLNGSGLAIGRTWLALIENYQQPDGAVIVPEVLRPYMGGLERITG